MWGVSQNNVKGMRGEYNKGYVKTTENQKKKHVNQMTEEEKVFLNMQLKEINIKNIQLSYHLEEKMEEINFKFSDITTILESADLKPYIIEYNEKQTQDKPMDRRVLLRDVKKQEVVYHSDTQEDFKAVSNLCFVISLETNRIITVYWNIVDDSHNTINWKRYDEKLKIIKTVENTV